MLGKKKSSPSTVFGLVLREVRIERLMSQEALAHEAELQRNYVSLIERGINQPTVTTIFKLCGALKMKPSEFLSLVEQKLSV
jgi:transcriptional regulator with XRE-family HTH domain